MKLDIALGFHFATLLSSSTRNLKPKIFEINLEKFL